MMTQFGRGGSAETVDAARHGMSLAQRIPPHGMKLRFGAPPGSLIRRTERSPSGATSMKLPPRSMRGYALGTAQSSHGADE